MTRISFKNRIAQYYIVSTALLIFAVFLVVYYGVKVSVYNGIDRDLIAEIETISEEIIVDGDNFRIADSDEWEEREHKALGINPIFIELVRMDGSSIEKSPNLVNFSLQMKKQVLAEKIYDTNLNNNPVRQMQFPVFHDSVLKGFILVAMPLQDAKMVLLNLAEILIIGYFLILLVLYFTTRLIVGRSIQPISAIIETADLISNDNLSARIPLPQNKDELYKLSETINDLLDRIEKAIEREKQFTSDASHELRTPLAVIKGTLEVLARKPRTQIEYEDKIKYCIAEVNRMNFLVDELLLLARFENQKTEIKTESTFLNALILDALTRYSEGISGKNLKVNTFFENDFYYETDPYLFSIVLHNLISNAIKYSLPNEKIEIRVVKQENQIIFTLRDSGLGIEQANIDKIFNPFYRSNASEHPEIKGTGLGLSIVNRLSHLLKFEIAITSEQVGTLVTMKMKMSK